MVRIFKAYLNQPHEEPHYTYLLGSVLPMFYRYLFLYPLREKPACQIRCGFLLVLPTIYLCPPSIQLRDHRLRVSVCCACLHPDGAITSLNAKCCFYLVRWK